MGNIMSIVTFIENGAEKDQLSQLFDCMKAFNIEMADRSGETTKDIQVLISVLQQAMKQVYNNKDLEGIVNTLISILFTVSVDEVAVLVKSLCEELEGAAEIDGKSLLCFKLLHTLFHGYPKENSFLYEVYCSMVKVASLSYSVQHLSCTTDKIASRMKTWNLSESQCHHLYRLLYEAHYKCGAVKKAGETMMGMLECFNAENAHEAEDDAVKCIRRALMNEEEYQFEHLVLLEPIKALKGGLLYELLTIFVEGNIQDYLKFASEANNRAFIEEEEIEDIIIDAIQRKLVRALIDGVNRKVIVSQAFQRQFVVADWQMLKKMVSKCSNQLSKVSNQLQEILLVDA